MKKQIQILISFCLVAESLFGGIKTCQEIARLYNPHLELKTDAPLQWPASILQENQVNLNLQDKFRSYATSVPTGNFTGAHGVVIPYKIFRAPQERGAIVLVHGIKESGATFLENIELFVREGYSVYMMDQRGHGHADRETYNRQIVHVDNYDSYLSDLKTFMDTVVTEDPHERIYLVGNSMGGLISTLFAQKNGKAIDALVAAVPAYAINLKGVPPWAASLILKANRWLGRSESYVVSQGNFSKEEWKRHPVTHSDERTNKFLETLIRFPMHEKGGVSYQWLESTLKANKQVQEGISDLKVPTLLLSAGKDSVVNSNRISEFAKKSPVSFLYSEPEAFHALLFESDEMRNPVMTEVLRFLVNPIRLDRAPVGNEIHKLVSDAERYLAKGETAFALYAINEALRVQEWKKEYLPEWQSSALSLKLNQLHLTTETALKKASLGQQGLFMFLEYRRRLEMEKLYSLKPAL